MRSKEKLRLEIRIILHHRPTYKNIHPVNGIFQCAICNEG